MPYSVAKWLDSDPKVLLYINCPVSYKNNLSGLTPFSLQDPGYLNRMMALLPLMERQPFRFNENEGEVPIPNRVSLQDVSLGPGAFPGSKILSMA